MKICIKSVIRMTILLMSMPLNISWGMVVSPFCDATPALYNINKGQPSYKTREIINYLCDNQEKLHKLAPSNASVEAHQWETWCQNIKSVMTLSESVPISLSSFNAFLEPTFLSQADKKFFLGELEYYLGNITQLYKTKRDTIIHMLSYEEETPFISLVEMLLLHTGVLLDRKVLHSFKKAFIKQLDKMKKWDDGCQIFDNLFRLVEIAYPSKEELERKDTLYDYLVKKRQELLPTRNETK